MKLDLRERRKGRSGSGRRSRKKRRNRETEKWRVAVELALWSETEENPELFQTKILYLQTQIN
jgi:hypothetical protein